MDPQNIPNPEKKKVHKPSPCVGVASALLMTRQHQTVFQKNIEIQIIIVISVQHKKCIQWNTNKSSF